MRTFTEIAREARTHLPVLSGLPGQSGYDLCIRLITDLAEALDHAPGGTDQITDDPEYRSPQDWANLNWVGMDWTERARMVADLRAQICRTTSSHRLAAELAMACPLMDAGLQELADAHSRLALADAMLAQAGMFTAEEARRGISAVRYSPLRGDQ